MPGGPLCLHVPVATYCKLLCTLQDLDDTGLPEDGDKAKAAVTNGKDKEVEDARKGEKKDGEKEAEKK